MKHAEAIAERLAYLGGVPTTTPAPIFVGETLKEMIERDKKDEEKAIEFYKKIIEKAQEEGDITTARIFRKILEDEEGHHDFFSSLLEEIQFNNIFLKLTLYFYLVPIFPIYGQRIRCYSFWNWFSVEHRK